jgi:RHS repeat-associated protein
MTNLPHNQRSSDAPSARSTQDSRSTGQTPPAATREIPQITLPKGGGALKGIDEKFSVNAANGTASFSIPFPVSPGRNEFMPSLSLAYNSGAGNGPFGLSWGVDYPTIQRRTDRQLPRYHDETDSDVFLFAGAEDLVPVFTEETGDWQPDRFEVADYRIRRYRPRVEGSFARIEQIHHASDAGFYWKVTAANNTVTFFGKSPTHRLSDPNDPARTYQWLPEISFDDKGNCITYVFKPEDKADVEKAVHEKNRLSGQASFVNQYLKRIRYGNISPYKPDTRQADQCYSFFPPSSNFLFEIVLDYGEHSDNRPTETAIWPARIDSFSSYRSGFEIRTYRLCQRILQFHWFTEREFGLSESEVLTPYLVRSLDFTYQYSSANSTQQLEVTYLASVTQKGYIKQAGEYISEALPPLEFSYQELRWHTESKSIAQEDAINAPVGVSSTYHWVDLYAEGLSGILTEQADAWYYSQNMGEATFSPASKVSPKPSFTGLSIGKLQLQDLNADGNRQAVVYGENLAGFFALTDDNNWAPFRTFNSQTNVDLTNPNVRVLDLTGDGKPDLVISEEHAFVWYASLGTDGYSSPERTAQPWDEEQGPTVVFSDPVERIFLADMTGDGLTDIARIRNGEVCYWPNLGYGRFGAKVIMSRSPLFDKPDAFNPSYLHLADVSGTGATDLLYLGKNNFSAWLNLSGNAWSDVCVIDPFPGTARPNDVSVVDLLGNGTSCIVWSSPLPAHERAPMRYIDLMGSQKPHLLRSYVNNFGKETILHYTSSTQFFMADRQAGRPWVTKLPFPVNCLSKVEVIEHVTNTRLTSSYVYHHGYYDHTEREFRGFGMVEQTDSEVFAEYRKQTLPDGSVQLVDEGLFQPPVLTKTWFHTGAFLNRTKVLNQFAHEYYQNEIIPEQSLVEPDLPDDWTTQEWREALRACKGQPLRVEIYALDSSDKQPHPYTTAYHNCLIRRLQPRLNNKYTVFLAVPGEALTYTYERNPADPRVGHTMTIKVDQFGNVIQSAAISYGRQLADPILTAEEQLEQKKTRVIVTQNVVTNAIEELGDYRLPALCDTQTYELTGLAPTNGAYVSTKQLTDAYTQAEQIDYQDISNSNQFQKRLIEHVRHTFLTNNLSAELPLGVLESLALPYQSYQLALTPSLVDEVFGNKVTETMLLTEGRYIHVNDANYWIASGTQTFDADQFYQATALTDAFGNKTQLTYDSAYHLFIQNITDAVGNTTEVTGFNFRTLTPYLITDANDNRSGVRFNALRMITSTFVMGKAGEKQGDLLDETAVEQSSADQPTSTMEYDLSAYRSNGKPVSVKTSMRETHYFDSLATGSAVRGQTTYAYSNGHGREIMRKVQAPPGLVKQLAADGTVIEVDTTPNLRWIGSGRTVLNNKGNPVKQYEPYFSTTPNYEDARQLVEVGVSPVLYYDSLNRLIRTDFPNGTLSKLVFDAWRQQSFDTNDTVLDSQWYRDRILTPDSVIATPTEQNAATKAAIHAATPARSYLNALGQSFLSIANNAAEGQYKTLTEMDIEGNVRKIIDARGNVVMQYRYDMLGNQLYSLSMDTGERWSLNDVFGKPIRGWDNRNHEFSFGYDALHRLMSKHVKGGDGAAPLDHVFERVIFGENQSDDKAKNLRTKPVIVYDTAGKTETVAFDFKGNALTTSRRFAVAYKEVVNWNNVNSDSALEPEIVSTLTTYDALNRVIRQQTPDGSIHEPVYNETGLLKSLTVTQNGTPETFIKSLTYNSKGQRQQIRYGNDLTTRYSYDPTTFRLIQLQTVRPDNELLQDLHYTYDPVGNITQQLDKAVPVVFFNNQKIEGLNDYTYDAIYQLKIATGREQNANSPNVDVADNWQDAGFLLGQQPGDPMAMRLYTQRYQYDVVGNIRQMQHAAGATGSWTRDYTYADTNNRLLKTQIGNQTYGYTYHEQHGFITAMPHLPAMQWNFNEQLQAISRQTIANGTPETTYYVYDGSGQRVRKITERQAASGASTSRKSEQIYLGAAEFYREYDPTGTLTLERQTTYVMDDKSRIAMIETRTVGTDNSPQRLVRYQFSNQLGSVSLETDATARVISYEEYHPFGTTAYQATDKTIKAAFKRYRYTGMERDDESGLAYHTARYYIPWLGRWLSADPLLVTLHDNTNDANTSSNQTEQITSQEAERMVNLCAYCYCSNNPLNRIDPSGLLDYYNSEGGFLGNNGDKKDKNALILLNKDDAKTVKAAYSGSWWRRALNFLLSWLFGRDAFLKKTPTAKNKLKGDTLSLPSEYVRRKIGNALDQSNKPTGNRRDPNNPNFQPDPKGGFHEEGGVWGVTDTGREMVWNAHPGSYANPKTDDPQIQVTNIINTSINGNFSGSFHIHPSGIITERSGGASEASSGVGMKSSPTTEKTYQFNQEPSKQDLSAAKTFQASGKTTYHIVVGARSGYVYLYTSQSLAAKRYTAKFPLSIFLKGLRP